MHTLKLIFGGFLLSEYACYLGAGWRQQRLWSPLQSSIFSCVWLAATLVNMWVGVSKAATPSG